MFLAASISATFGPTPRTYITGVSRPGTVWMLNGLRPAGQTRIARAYFLNPLCVRARLQSCRKSGVEAGALAPGGLDQNVRKPLMKHALRRIRFVDAHLCFNGFGQGEFGSGEVVHLLKVEPELRAVIEEAGQAKRRVGSDGALA